MKTAVYLAGALYSRGQRDYLETVAAVLEDRYQVYVPHRDGGLYNELMRGGRMLIDEAAREIRANDVAAIDACGLLLAVVHGRYVVDPGVCFEIGYAFARGKPCHVLAPDLDMSSALNPMIRATIDRVHVRLADLTKPLHQGEQR